MTHKISGKSVSVTDFGASGNGSTDDYEAIQEALDSDAETVLIPKGVYAVTKTLKISSDTSIIAHKNAKIFLWAKTMRVRNDFLLTNRDSGGGNVNISISGGIWDGNNFGEFNKKANLFDKNGYSGATLNFVNIKNLSLSDMTISNPPAYYVRMSRLDGFTIRDIRFFSENRCLNQDGLHFCGEVRNGLIENITAISDGQTNDDLIALNADDSIERVENLDLARGPIENITIRNITAANCHTFIRILSVDAPIKNVSIENIKGGCRNYFINMDAARYCMTPLFNDEDRPDGVGAIESVHIKNADICRTETDNSTPFIVCESNATDFSVSNCKLRGSLPLSVTNVTNRCVSVLRNNSAENKYLYNKEDHLEITDEMCNFTINRI